MDIGRCGFDFCKGDLPKYHREWRLNRHVVLTCRIIVFVLLIKNKKVSVESMKLTKLASYALGLPICATHLSQTPSHLAWTNVVFNRVEFFDLAPLFMILIRM